MTKISFDVDFSKDPEKILKEIQERAKAEVAKRESKQKNSAYLSDLHNLVNKELGTAFKNTNDLIKALTPFSTHAFKNKLASTSASGRRQTVSMDQETFDQIKELLGQANPNKAAIARETGVSVVQVRKVATGGYDKKYGSGAPKEVAPAPTPEPVVEEEKEEDPIPSPSFSDESPSVPEPEPEDQNEEEAPSLPPPPSFGDDAPELPPVPEAVDSAPTMPDLPPPPAFVEPEEQKEEEVEEEAPSLPPPPSFGEDAPAPDLPPPPPPPSADSSEDESSEDSEEVAEPPAPPSPASPPSPPAGITRPPTKPGLKPGLKPGKPGKPTLSLKKGKSKNKGLKLTRPPLRKNPPSE